jgi:hypothetical protein
MKNGLHLTLAPDELGQTADGSTLQPRAQRSEAGDLAEQRLWTINPDSS